MNKNTVRPTEKIRENTEQNKCKEWPKRPAVERKAAESDKEKLEAKEKSEGKNTHTLCYAMLCFARRARNNDG